MIGRPPSAPSPRPSTDARTPPSKEAGRIAGMFDAIAPRYDLLNSLLSAGFDRRWRTQAIRSLVLTGEERLLDVCAGTAGVALAARRGRAGARRVIGVDFAGAMLDIGRRKVEAAGEEHAIALLRADATRLPIREGGVDAVTAAFGVRNVEDAGAACREMHRVLRAGGRLAILEFAFPTVPVVRQAYRGYFTRVLPLVGRLVSRHSTAYSYLPASVGGFPPPEQFVALLLELGFADVVASRLTLGVVYLYSARKA